VKTLQLVTTPRSFFEEQVDALTRRGVECTTLPVHPPVEGDGSRTVADYLRYPPAVLSRAMEGYDLVHANHGLVAPFAFAQPVRPVVVTFWGSELLDGRTRARRLVQRTSKLSAGAADAVILPSEAMRDDVDVKHAVIPFGVDTDRFRPIPREVARERVGWEPDARKVLFPYDPARDEKDYPRAVEVVSRLDVDAELAVVSDAPYEMMPYYLNASDALLLTSGLESGPMVVKEAVACNVPVVSTDVGFVRDAVAGVSNSTVCDTTECLVDALDRALRSGERANGRETAECTDPDETARSIHRVYEEVLSGRW